MVATAVNIDSHVYRVRLGRSIYPVYYRGSGWSIGSPSGYCLRQRYVLVWI